MATDASGSAGKRRALRLAVSDRLRKRFEYRRVRDQGRRVYTASFVLQVAPNAEPQVRLGLTVSRQVGGAVRRNRVKRLVREIFRQHRSLFPAGADVVVIAKAGCKVDSLLDVEREFSGASAALQRALRKAAPERKGARS